METFIAISLVFISVFAIVRDNRKEKRAAKIQNKWR